MNLAKPLSLVFLIGATIFPSHVFATVSSNCTIFVSPSGNDANSGATPTTAKTLRGGANAAQPGDVVCLEAGTYNLSGSFGPPRSGTASGYITYQAYGNGAANLVWTGSNVSGGFIVNLDSSAGFPNGYAYLKFIGLNLDGQGMARNGFFARYGHHLLFKNNYVKNTEGAGIGLVNCDYVTSDHNLIWRNGNQNSVATSATSGISYNLTRFYDTYPGFHNIISNNIISGDQDTVANTDGNGIIMDMSGSTGATGVSNANTPPALIINNVIYENSGDCIVNFTVSNIWTINNTCYKNSLNINSTFVNSHAGEIGDNASKQDVFVNNVSYAWKQSIPAYFSNNGSVLGTWYRNMYYVGTLGFTPTDPTQFVRTDPLYNNPPYVDPSASGQYANAPDPQSMLSAFTLQPNSPAVGKGIDPSTLPGLNSAIVSDLRKWIYTDINGNSRPQNGSFDLGAFQHSASTPPSPPTGLIAIPH